MRDSTAISVSRRRRRSYGAARLPAVVTPSAGPRDTRTGSPSRLLLLLLVAVLTGILTLLVGVAGSANAVTSTASGAVATTAHTASGPTGAAAETRVGASTVAVASLVGAADGIAAGQRRGEGSLRPGFVSATSVAAESGGGILANQAAGNAARDAIAAANPGSLTEQTFNTALGARRVDVLTQDGLAIESKVGRNVADVEHSIADREGSVAAAERRRQRGAVGVRP